MIYFIVFGIFDLKLIYSVWIKLNESIISQYDLLKKKIIRFYVLYFFLFILLIMFSFTALVRLYYVIAITCFAWIPFIYSNTFKTKVTLPPLIYMLAISFNRIAMPLYFRAYDDNIFSLETYKLLPFVLISILAFQLLFMYLQVIYNGNFYLPEGIRSKIKREHTVKSKTLTELIQFNREFDKQECLICLTNLIDSTEVSEVQTHSQGSHIYKSSNEILETSRSDAILQVDVNSEVLKAKSTNDRMTCLRSLKYIIDFLKFLGRIFLKTLQIMFCYHNFTKDDVEKIFMLTKCGHAFHRKCLEEWLKVKRECPNDRTLLYYE